MIEGIARGQGSLLFAGQALRTSGRRVQGTTFGLALGVFLAGPAFAGGADVSADAIYSDDIAVTTWDGMLLDIDQDDNVDLAVASNRGGADQASRYYPGNGDGTFGDPVLLSSGAASEIVAGDLNGDMFLDLVLGRRDLSNLYHLGDGMTVADGVDISADANRTLTVALGDLDLDGDLDVVTGNGVGGASMTPQRNRFCLNGVIQSGTLAFTCADISLNADVTRAVALADIDRDGDPDVLAGNDETTPGGTLLHLNLFLPLGSVVFSAPISFGDPNDQTAKILVGDLDLDDDLDVVTLNFPSDLSAGVNRFFINEGFGFTPGDVSADVDATSGGALADFDGDGDLDLAVANIGAPNRLYLNQVPAGGGAVTFAAGIDISPDVHDSRELAAIDLNGDDALDIVVGNQDQPDRRYLNNGTADPFTNVAPVINDQTMLQADEGEPLTISLANLTVVDPDNVYPADFTLTVQPGTNYTVEGSTVTPQTGIPLTVPVVVNDGTADSVAFELAVSVVPAPRSGGSGATGILSFLALLGLLAVIAGRPAHRKLRLPGKLRKPP